MTSSSFPLSVGPSTAPAPKGWKWRHLAEIARLESGHTPSRRRPDWWGGGIPWLALPDIRALDGAVAHRTLEQTNEAGIANSSARVLPAGTVVLSRTATVGFVTILGREMATSQDFVNWVCGPDLDPRFLSLLFRQSRTFIRSLASGAIHKTVYVPTVKAFWVCVPPLKEQVRIAERLEEQLEAVARARAAAEARLEAANHLAGAHRRAILDDGLAWPRVPMKDLLASPMRTGISKQQMIGSEVKCLTLSAVRQGCYLDTDCSKPVDLGEEEAGQYSVRPGAFYVVRGNGNLSLVGRGSEARARVQSNVVFPDLLIEMVLKREVIWAPFFRMIWDSSEIRGDIERRARTSAGIYKINLGNLREIKIPLPSLEDQRIVASKFGELSRDGADISAAVASQAAAFAALPATLLRRAFRGEL